jgi:monoterpene epsilon-lactone hydrolase
MKPTMWLAILAGALMPAIALSQPQPIIAPTAVPAAPTGADMQYAVPRAVSPEAAAILGAMLQVQRASLPLRSALGTDFAALRARAEEGVEARAAATIQRTGITVTPDTVGGVPVLRIVPPGAATGGRVLVYVHGGGWALGSARGSLNGAAIYAVATGLPVISVDYGLAPEHDFRDITGQVVAVYRALLSGGHRPNQIGMFGDSAGGNIIPGSMLRARDEGLPMPAALVLLSPCFDLGEDGDTRTTLAAAEPALDLPVTLRAMLLGYAGSPENIRNPWASPVYGDFSRGFPPTLIQGGTRELLVSDFVRGYQAIRAGGNEAVLDIYEGMPHVFMTYLSATPEGRRAITTARDFFLARLVR